MPTSANRMDTVRTCFRDTLIAEFLNQFRTLSPMTASEFGTLLNLVGNYTLYYLICHNMVRKGWIYHTRKGKRMGKKSKPRVTDTIHYNGPRYSFHKDTVFRVLVSE